ncbi:homoserine dehydrogenase [Candidatus Bipolaricaulota bacterium]
MNSVRTVRVLLVGVGNLGRRFAQLIADKREELLQRYGLDVRLVGVADFRGAAIAPDGLDGAAIAAVKEAGGSVADLPEAGRPGMTGLELIDTVTHSDAIGADLLCEASPVNLDAGAEPGLSHVRRALEKGLHVSTPNKGPIVLAYRELTALAQRQGVQLRFDGTVAGGLPAIALGARDLRGATIQRLDTVPNLTTGFVLDRLATGIAWDDAIEEARTVGALEGDGVWDLDGWDAAAKLAILALSVLDLGVDLQDVPRQGIRGIDLDWLKLQNQNGLVRLLANAVRRADGGYDLNVTPTALPPEHPLGRLGSKQMGITYETDLFGTITSIIDEPTPLPSAASMLRDLLGIYLAD